MNRLALLVLLFASQSYAQNISGLVPDSIEGRPKSDSARIYAGDDLYRLIDGGADIFKEYGFDTVVVQRYSDMRDDYVDVELYQMKDSSAAYGIFSAVTFTTGRRIDDFPCEAYAGDGFLLFWKGKYYGSLTATQPLDSRVISKAAEMIAGRIQGSGRPYLVSILDKLGLRDSPDFKDAYLKGGLGLSNLGVISSASDFKFKEGVCIVTKGVKCLVFLYDTEGECIERYCNRLIQLRDTQEWNQVRPGRDSGLFERHGEYLKILRIGKYLVTATSKDKAKVDETSEALCAVLK